MDKVFVTGAAGFIGGNLVDRLFCPTKWIVDKIGKSEQVWQSDDSAHSLLPEFSCAAELA